MTAILDSLTEAAEWTLWNSLGGAAFVLLLLGMLTFFGKRLSPSLRLLLWALVAVRLVLPFTPESPASLANLLPAASTEIPEATTPSTPLTSDPFLAPAETLGTASATPVSVQAWPWQLTLSLVWASIALAMLVRASWAQLRTAHWINQQPRVSDRRLLALIHECRRMRGITRHLELVAVSEQTSVAVFGGLQATHLLIPKDLAERYSQVEIRGILLHELEHVRRQDLLWNWLWLLLRALHWFNPLVWLAHRRFLADREMVCDQAALRHLPDATRQDYGSTLLKMMKQCSGSSRTANVLPFIPTPLSETKRRLTMILKPQSLQSWAFPVIALFTLAACALTFTTALADDESSKPSPEEKAGPSDSKETHRDGDTKKEGPGDAGAKKEGPRDGDMKKEGPGDAGAKKEGPRDGDMKKEGPGDAGARKEGGDKGGPSPEAKGQPDPAMDPALKAKLRTKEGKIFTTYDKDKSGGVTAEEIANMFERERSRREMRDLKELVEEIDKDGNKESLNLDEFILYLQIRRSGRG